MAAKLVNNVLGISSYAMLLEAMQLAAAYGMDEDVVNRLRFLAAGATRGTYMPGVGRTAARRERLTAGPRRRTPG